MTRREALIGLLIAIAMISAGLTWRYGPWGLAGTGIAVLITTTLIMNEREDDKPDD